MPTKRITRAFRPLGGNIPQQTQKRSDSASLVDFLNAAQVNDVCFLPVAYQKSLGSIGKGLSGAIQQSTADISTVLTFKEGVPSKHQRDTEQEQDWYSLVTEVTVLQHLSIRENHHIIDLLGVTFRVESTQDKERRAFPLLVTSKVNRGDLASFILEKEGGKLTPNIRLQLLAEVAEAIRLLHNSGVAHGDIKPENFLLEESENELNCRLIDFGSCSIQGQKRLPTKSAPWNAPELDFAQELTTDALILSDIYSFGLLCVHIILPLEDLVKANILFLRRSEETDDQWGQFLSAMVGKKRKDLGHTLAFDILKATGESSIPAAQKLLMQEIVSKTIQTRSDRRTFPWAEMLPHIEKYLSENFITDPHIGVAPPPLAYSSPTMQHTEHKIFSLAASIGEIDDTDYILRQNILQDMIFKANSTSCLICRQEYAFEVAVCYIIGFGVVKDEYSSRDWLAKSGKAQEDVVGAIELLGADYKMTGRLPKRVLDALGIGVVVSTDRTEEYQISGRLLAAEAALQNEISARKDAFGPEHRSLARLMMDMVMVLKARNQPSEAERIQKEVVDILTKSFGDRHPSVLLANVNLASILADEGWLQKAEELQRHVQPILAEVLGPEHPETITASQILATILVSQGKYREAQKILREVASSRTRVLTKMHPQTIRAEISLVAVLRAQGLLNQASDLMGNIDEKVQSIITDDHLTKAHLFISQANLYKELGLLDKATENAVSALKAVEKLNVLEDDSLRLTALEGMASIYEASWKLKEQEDILREVLQIKSSLDRCNPLLLSTKAMLARNLLNQNLLDEASAVAKEVLDAPETSVAVDTENFLACTDVLATSLFRQGKKDEAEEKRSHLLSSCENVLGKTHPFTLDAAYSLGEFYADEGAYGRAEGLYMPVLQHFRDFQQLGKDAIKVAAVLAVANREQGKYDDAESLCKEAIMWGTEAFGEGHLETLAVYDILGRTYLMRDKRSDAENLYVTKLEKQSQGTELEIYVKNNLAELKRLQGQPEVAKALMYEALELSETRHGKMHPTSISMAGNILGISLGENLTAQLEEMALANIQAKEKVFGVTHPSTIKTVSDLAYAYSEHGRFEDAQRLYQGIEDAGGLEALEQTNPSRYATFCGKLGDMYFRQEQLEKAEEFEKRALSIREQLYGDSHRATLVSMANLASTLHAQDKYVEAGEYLRHIANVREETVNADPQSLFLLLQSKVSLAANLFFQDKLEEAAQLYRDVLEKSEIIGVDSAITDTWRADFEKVLEKLPEQEIPQR